MRKERRESKATGIMVLALFVVLAVCILSVLLLGADVYRGLTERDQHSYDRRTAAQYFATRVRQADTLDGVSVEDFGGVVALALRERYGSEVYVTWIYCYDGYIRELFAAEGGDFLPSDGEKILPALSLALERLPDGLRLVVTDENAQQQELTLYLRSREVSGA